MSCWPKEELENMLMDVVDELQLSEAMIEKHGPLGTAPSELVRLVLDQKGLEIRALKQGFVLLASKKLKTTKDGWDEYEHYFEKGEYRISKTREGDKTKYTLLKNKKPISVHDSFEEAKPKKIRTNEEWLAIGKKAGILPRVNESWKDYKQRLRENENAQT